MSASSSCPQDLRRIGRALLGSGLLALAALTGAGCYYASDAGNAGGPDASTASTEFPCEAAKVLATCWSCHGTPPRGGATFSLDKRSDLLAPSTVAPAQTMAERSLIRLRAATNPMPPVGYPKPSATEIDAFATWITNGMPAGTCAGTDPNQPAPTVCTSGSKWPPNTNTESKDMNPGLACVACHARGDTDKRYTFMGTAYPTLHEQDRCYATGIPVGTKVQIIDANGVIAVTMDVRTGSGNFHSAVGANIAMPYTAQVITPSGSKMVMTTKQTSGDCNACHTEQGKNGATGRIMFATP